MHEDIGHMKHCIEYLRHSIMCNADMNIEHRDLSADEFGKKHTTGWETHFCRDYQEIFKFAEKWRIWDGKTKETQRKITNLEVIGGRIINY